MMRFFLISVVCLAALFLSAAQASQKTLAVGDAVPNFTLLDDQGEPWSLKKAEGHVLVVYFYPADNTPGCTKEACSVNSEYREFKRKGVQVVGINYNSVASHRAFKEKHGLRFTLLSDPQANVARMFGADRWWPNLVPQRKTYVIDRKGVLRSVIENVTPSTHAKQIMQVVDQLS